MKRSVVREIWLAACLALGGCITQPRTLRIDAAVGMFQDAAITYRVDGGQLSEPLTVSRIAGQRVTEERLPSSPHPDRSVVRLSIRYPHPKGKAGYALAEMVVETHAPPGPQAETQKAVWQEWIDAVADTAQDVLPGVKTSDGVYEAWALDIAKRDLDRVIAGMSQSGYFVNPSKATLGVELAARIDRFQADKRWTREAELDVLIERIRREGQLVSYTHPVQSGMSGASLAAAQNTNRATLASHDQAGPALAPAGPQNNAYSAPPPTMPASAAPPRQQPAASEGLAPRAPQPPAVNAPAPAARPNAKQRKRWQYPPQYRRGPSAPGQATPSRSAPAGAKPPAGRDQTSPLQRAISPLQRALRMPWQRSPAAASPASKTGSPQSAHGQNVRRPWTPRNGGQQPPPRGRLPAQYQPPAANPPSPNGHYTGYPQANRATANGDYSPGFPRPPSDAGPAY